MNSKIDRHKQVFSLLKTKVDKKPSSYDSFSIGKENAKLENLLSQAQFLNQVYNFHKSIIQNINVGLFIIDLNGVITFANRKSAQWLQYEVTELLNKNIQKLFLDNQEAVDFLKLISIPGKILENYETTFLVKNSGKMLVGIDTSSFKDEKNQFNGVVLLFRDLTEVNDLRNQVERMERLALLGELSSRIAHEIRNPLGGIKAAAQLLEETLGSNHSNSDLIKRIIKEVDKSNRLLKEFFKFAKPSKPKPQFIDLSKVIDNVYLLLAPQINKKNIKFKGNYQENNLHVFVDETQIEQVIMNLFLNAIDVLPDGGLVTVSTQKQKVKFMKNDKYSLSEQELYYVIVLITDNGKGIKKDILTKIFTPFFTTKSDGIGLGLSICSRLVEENRGKIDVTSNNNGTTFSIALPTFVHN